MALCTKFACARRDGLALRRAAAGTGDAPPVGMLRHSTAIVALFFVFIGLFVVAVVAESALMAFVALVVGAVSAFVMAVAWMRPASYPPEHHPKIDRLFDDTDP